MRLDLNSNMIRQPLSNCKNLLLAGCLILTIASTILHFKMFNRVEQLEQTLHNYGNNISVMLRQVNNNSATMLEDISVFIDTQIEKLFQANIQPVYKDLKSLKEALSGISIPATEISSNAIIAGTLFELNNPKCNESIRYRNVIYVYTRDGGFERRRFVRYTYGNESVLARYNMTLRFLIGLPKEKYLTKVLAEQSLYRDLVVLPTHSDEYKKLNGKSAMGLSWLYKNCNNSDTYMKIDDDILVDYPPLYKYILEEVPKYPNDVHCQKIVRLQLTHCHGHLILFHHNVLAKLLSSVPQVTTTNWVEDQYSYGYLRNTAGVGLIDTAAHKVWLAYNNSSMVTREVVKGEKWYYGDHINDMMKWWNILQSIHQAKATNNFTGIQESYLYLGHLKL